MSFSSQSYSKYPFSSMENKENSQFFLMEEKSAHQKDLFTNIGTWSDFVVGNGSSGSGNGSPPFRVHKNQNVFSNVGTWSDFVVENRCSGSNQHVLNNIGTWSDFVASNRSSDSGIGSEGSVSPPPPSSHASRVQKNPRTFPKVGTWNDFVAGSSSSSDSVNGSEGSVSPPRPSQKKIPGFAMPQLLDHQTIVPFSQRRF